MILLDTSVVIELVERRSGFSACARWLQRYEPHQVHVSAITIFEFESGLLDGSPSIRSRRTTWGRLLLAIKVEPLGSDIASHAAQIVRTTARLGRQIGGMDALIAATAIGRGLTLATRDADFDRIIELKVETWQ